MIHERLAAAGNEPSGAKTNKSREKKEAARVLYHVRQTTDRIGNRILFVLGGLL